LDEEAITSSAIASMEKYRPCNYDIGPSRGDGDDINDIRDYYSGLATRQRAMRRVYDFNSPDQVCVYIHAIVSCDILTRQKNLISKYWTHSYL
jgi:hypothetical protein